MVVSYLRKEFRTFISFSLVYRDPEVSSYPCEKVTHVKKAGWVTCSGRILTGILKQIPKELLKGILKEILKGNP